MKCHKYLQICHKFAFFIWQSVSQKMGQEFPFYQENIKIIIPLFYSFAIRLLYGVNSVKLCPNMFCMSLKMRAKKSTQWKDNPSLERVDTNFKYCKVKKCSIFFSREKSETKKFVVFYGKRSCQQNHPDPICFKALLI